MTYANDMFTSISQASASYTTHLNASLEELKNEIRTVSLKTAIQQQWAGLTSPEAIALYKEVGALIALVYALAYEFCAQVAHEQSGTSPDYLSLKNFVRACLGRSNAPEVKPAPEVEQEVTMVPYCPSQVVIACNSVVTRLPLLAHLPLNNRVQAREVLCLNRIA
jgi:hypothetical protein